jgi:hypothetical protein
LQFLAGSLAEHGRTAAIGEVECLAERLASVHAVSTSSECGSVVGQRAGVFELSRGVLEFCDGLL